MTAAPDLRISEPPRTLRELALEKMRAAILDLHFPPGTRLVERDVGQKLGVSRSVVREVIRHLESEGLVYSVPHQGPVVATLDAATAAQIYEIRAALEFAAAFAAAEKASDLDIARMDRALADISAAYATGDHRGVLAATTRFYEAMFLSGGKTVAWDMVQRLNGRISQLRAMTISSRERNRSGPAQMRKIVDAIRARDSQAAALACREHVESAAAIAARLLADIPS
ncbi:GntR family transcriptional regulator [Aestuariivirga sp.]|uniref:GntR family transcriptional regulator n=1 Tax=Aestuariivirga sp. TaxID=2650926 RepID=UPI0039E53DDA